MNNTISISPLCFHPDWISEVALWHHQEWLKARSEEQVALPEEEKQQKFEQRKRILRTHLNEVSMPITFVAHHDLVAVGTVSLIYYHFSRAIKPSEWLTNFFVLPEYRAAGIGSRLLETVVDFARHKNLPRIFLYTHDQTDFYLKRKWQRSSRGVVLGRSVEILSLTI